MNLRLCPALRVGPGAVAAMVCIGACWNLASEGPGYTGSLYQ